FLLLYGLGVALCLVAGGLVYRFAAPLTTHLVWAGGLLVLLVSAALAPRGADRQAAWSRRDWLAVAALVVLSLALFGWHLTSVPPEVHGDDAEVGLDAIRLLDEFNLFGAGWFELPRFHALPTAIGLQLFGINLFGLRATSVGLGIATVLLLFAVARRLWSFEVALLAAVLLAGQRFFIHLSRTGYHYIDTPFLALLAVWLLLRLWHDRRLDAAVYCGIALGLGIQTYYASRLVPPLLALTWLLWLRGTPAAERRGRVAAFALIVVAALAVAAPMFGYFAHDWAAFWERTRDTSMFTPAAQAHLAYGYGTQSVVAILAIQLRAAFSLFNLTPDNSMQYGLGGALFDPASAALFVLGVGLILARLAERRAQMVLLWTLLPLIAGGALTIDAPFYPRISGLMPFAVLIVALALMHCWSLARWTLPERRGGWLAGALLAAAVGLIYSDNLRSYFLDYAPNHRHSPGVEISAFVRRHGAGKTTYMLGGAPGFFIRHGAISFQTYGYKTRDIENPTEALAHQPFDPATSLFVVMPQGVHLVPQLEATVGPLDLQTHRNRHGAVAFLTAVPHATGEASDPPDLLLQGHPPGALARGFATALDLAARAARGVLT
ncbi:MAG: glycosyltransferase family 39 protein, partial [Candidatus Binatia bacterium]